MKKAMLAVSFGTTHVDAEKSCIRPVEDALRRAFPEWDVRRAWTSRIIQKRLRGRGVGVENEAEAMARLRAEGYDRIVVVPTHIIAGGEYGMAALAAGEFPVSRPLLADEGDLLWMANLLQGIAREEGRPLLMMGHGTGHAANETYARLREKLPEGVCLACVEGEYSLDALMPALMRLPSRALTLMPLMLVAGDHAKNDMAGDGDSWKNRLKDAGFDVRVRLQGLGSLPAVQARFVEKARAAIG